MLGHVCGFEIAIGVCDGADRRKTLGEVISERVR
jgi:hypothetical protein